MYPENMEMQQANYSIQIEEMHKLISDIENKLTPVLRYNELQESALSAKEPNSSKTPLEATLREITHRLREINNKITI